MQFDFRIDREPSGDTSVEVWQARCAWRDGWSRFRLAVRSDHAACEINSTRLEARLVGRAMSRELDATSEPSGRYASGPFGSTLRGDWTVLEVLLPEEDASFLLGLAGRQGRGTIVLHRSDCAEAVLQILREVLGWDALHLSGPSGAEGPDANNCETGSTKPEPSGWLQELDEFFEVIS